MSIYNFNGYLAQPSTSPLGAELVGFNPRTGQFVQAAAGLGSYLDLTPEYYQTFQHESWQHPGGSGWTSANVPGWGENPNLQMFRYRGVGEDAPAAQMKTALWRSALTLAIGGALVFWLYRKVSA